MGKLLLALLIAAIFCLLYFQTNRSIFVRSAGLFMIMACAFLLFITEGHPGIGHLIYLAILMSLGFASDYYSASLRTWYFRVSDESLWGIFIGSFIGLIFAWLMGSIVSGLIVGALLGALIGEIKAKGYQSLKQVGKATLGAFAGIFGMALKLLIGLEMSIWILSSTLMTKPI